MKKVTLYAVLLVAVGCGRNPQPVSVVSPATRPDLKLNAFLFSNNTVMGCNTWLATRLPQPGKTSQVSTLAAAPPGTSIQPDPQDHYEPPIEGFDGSFQLKAPAQALLGTSDNTIAICGVPAGSADHHWELRWKVWDQSGAEIPLAGNSRKLSVPLKMTVEFDSPGGNAPEVVISRFTDNHGESWRINAGNGSKFDTQSSGIHKLTAAASGFKMKRLTLSNDSPVELKVAGHANTCAAFKICHDGEDCGLTTVPPDCGTAVPNQAEHDHPPSRH